MVVRVHRPCIFLIVSWFDYLVVCRQQEYHHRPLITHGGGRGPNKFEKIAAARRESNAAIRKRQLHEVDIANPFVSPSTREAYEAVMAGPPHALTSSSFDERSWSSRLLLYPVLVGGIRQCDDEETSAGIEEQEQSAPHLVSRLKRSSSLFMDDRVSELAVGSKHSGTFLCRPEQKEIARGGSG